MRRVLRRVRGRAEAASDLDLVPILNLVAMLIPLLLLSSRLGGVAVIAAEPAVAGGGRSPDVVLRVHDGGFEVDGDDDVPFDPGPIACAPAPCDDPARWPYDALVARLGRVADHRPAPRQLTIVVAPTVPYEVLVRAMDAVRSDLRDPARPRPLFPNVAVSTSGGAP